MKKILSVLVSLAMLLSAFPAFAASDAVQADADALTIDAILSVPEWDGDDSVNTLIDNLEIDHITVGKNGSSISWSSSNTNVISNTGIVTRGDEDATVTLTATIGTEVTKDFTFLVPAAAKNINGMPSRSGDYTLNDDFGDGVADFEKDSSMPANSNTYYIESEGKLNLTNNAWGNNWYVRKRPASSETFAYEFTLGGDSNSCQIQVISDWNTGGKPLEMMCYRKDNKVIINGNTYAIPAQLKGENWKFTIYFDMNADTLTMWLNNNLFAESVEFPADRDSVAIFNVVICASGANDGRGTVLLDNLKVYPATPAPLFEAGNTAESKLLEYPAYTAADGIKYITNNLNFDYVKDENNVSYSFASSNTDVLSANGIITRAVIDTPVTVTATLTDSNGVSDIKSFDYVVPGKYNSAGKTGLPKEGEVVKYAAYDSNFTPSHKLFTNAPYVENGIFKVTDNQYGNSSDGGPYAVLSPDVGVWKHNSGKVAYELIFDFDKKDAKFYGKMNIDLLGQNRYTKTGRVTFSMNGDNAAAIIYGSRKFTGLVKMTLVSDYDAGKVDFYMNDELIDSNITLDNSAATTGARIAFDLNTKGDFNFYSYRAYKIDETTYPSIMKGTESYSNGGTVTNGTNSVTVPVIATNADGEAKGGTLVYAIYETVGGIKQLTAVKTVDMNLNQYSHKAYTASVTLDSVPVGAEQKVFIFDNMNSIVPLETGEIPVQ
ncbi:MAG: hypothetical protein E7395_01420 [Ruminococcaceae bacterium]|nr:hypothetical protein [Oscillospiraceae bacterium]